MMFTTEHVQLGQFPKQNDLIENKHSLGTLKTANIDWGQIQHSRNNQKIKFTIAKTVQSKIVIDQKMLEE